MRAEVPSVASTILTRRSFLSQLARVSAALGGACVAFSVPAGWLRELGLGPEAAAAAQDDLAKLIRQAPRARYWISSALPEIACARCHDPATESGRVAAEAGPDFTHDGTMVRCVLCAQECLIAPGERGRCRARINVDGELRSLAYGRPITVHIDPIEKKPFYHFLPGSDAFSLATSGCPLHCRFCQNWEISQAAPEDYEVGWTPPAAVVGTARAHAAPVVAFTYNEPTVFTEYLTDIARAGRPLGLKHVLISCGFMQEGPLTEMCEVLDAIKIDLKGYSESFYRDVCGAELQPVLRSIAQVARSDAHLELVNLVVPTLNDSERSLRELVAWVAGELGPDVPLHFTRFHPDYQLQHLPPTPVHTLEHARELALAAGLHYPYVGNVPGHPGNNTYCPGCGRVVIERRGFTVNALRLRDGACAECGTVIAGVWA
jgi:pyruvate formate lyase activating enzyme